MSTSSSGSSFWLKYISDASEEKHAALEAEKDAGAYPEDQDVFRADLGSEWGDSFHKDQHKDLKADYVLANPPFNDSDWGGQRLRQDVRWKYSVPPVGNANFAWVQHFVHHLAPAGLAGFVLANGSMSSQRSGEGEIRKVMVEADLVDCMVALPGQLFYSTQIPVCLWFLSRDKKNGLGGRGKKMRNRI